MKGFTNDIGTRMKVKDKLADGIEWMAEGVRRPKGHKVGKKKGKKKGNVVQPLDYTTTPVTTGPPPPGELPRVGSPRAEELAAECVKVAHMALSLADMLR